MDSSLVISALAASSICNSFEAGVGEEGNKDDSEEHESDGKQVVSGSDISADTHDKVSSYWLLVGKFRN